MGAAIAKANETSAYWRRLLTPVFVTVVLAIFVMPTLLVRAYVLTCLWGWYLTSLSGLPPLRMVFAFGLILIATVLVGKPVRKPVPGQDYSIWQSLAFGLLGPLLALVIGWLGTLFI